MGFRIECPNCGPRSYREFRFGGEARGGDSVVERVWFRDNVAGPQHERWFHEAGCRRWTTVVRDTTTNEFLIQRGED
jgi:sarcosine oxidase, subunit delta